MRTSVAVLLVLAFVASVASAAPAAAELAWLSGDWRQCKDGEIVEERWLGPRGDMLVGANLTTSHDGKASWESLRIVRDGDAWVCWAAPMGRAPVPFRLVESSVGRAVFANAERAFPNRISYWRDGADLLARIEGTVQERSVAENWRFSPGNATDCAP